MPSRGLRERNKAMNKLLSIAIDGPSGAGKSSVAQICARELKILYLDTGAMYRAVGLYMLRKGVDLEEEAAISAAMPGVELDVKYVDGEQRVFLCGEDVSCAIRGEDVSRAASKVSCVRAVREAMVRAQRDIARGRSVVMDGRDIGTRVLPDATLKIFLTADVEARARRRFAENQAKGSAGSYAQVLSAIVERDRLDTSRAASPLVKAKDAVELDTTHMTLAQVANRVVELARAAWEGNRA